MSNDLEVYNDILHLHLRPWKVTHSEQKFLQLLHLLPIEHYRQQPLYELAFPKPLTGKTRYYNALIDNEAVAFLNKMDARMAEASNDNERKYCLHKALPKKLKGLLEDTQKEIVKQQLFFKTLEDPEQDKNLRDNAWIIQYLKYQLVRLYLEIQDQYAGFLKEDPVTQEDLHSIYFTEPVQRLIKTAPDLGLHNATIQKPSNTERNEFNPNKSDFRSTKKGILSYGQIIKRPDVFALFETALFEVKLIDNKYNFTNRHTEKQKLAAIYCWLILNRYFIKRNFDKLKDTKHVDFRKFLDYRYNANVDAQFRAWWRKPDELNDYLEGISWLKELPLC